MAYTLGNKCAKNLCKRTVLLQLIVENLVTCFFFGTQCSIEPQQPPSLKIYMMSYLRHMLSGTLNTTIPYHLRHGWSDLDEIWYSDAE